MNNFNNTIQLSYNVTPIGNNITYTDNTHKIISTDKLAVQQELDTKEKPDITKKPDVKETPDVKEKLDVKEELIEQCKICASDLIDDICKLRCNHVFHYECLYMSWIYSKIPECPYCRSPYSCTIFNKNKKKNINKNNKICIAILKTGKNKGKQCTYCAKTGLYCNIHNKNS